MTPTDEAEKPKSGKAGTDEAKEAAKRQAADTPPEGSKPDEGTRPGDLSSENDGGSQG